MEELKKVSFEEQKELKKHHGISDTEKVILLYGRLMPVKGHKFLLDALSKLSDERKSNLKVIFPGENTEYKKEIDSYAKELELEKMLVYPGYIKGQPYLSISDLMILPSKQEGFGIVNVEAFAMGVPVIRTKTAGYLDMEDCCFGVEYGDADALVELINCLWDDPERLDKMAKTASEKVERFSVKKMTEEYKSIYQECMR